MSGPTSRRAQAPTDCLPDDNEAPTVDVGRGTPPVGGLSLGDWDWGPTGPGAHPSINSRQRARFHSRATNEAPALGKDAGANALGEVGKNSVQEGTPTAQR